MAIIKPPIPLEDIVVSTAQGFWPLAPGWWILISILLALISWISYITIKNRNYHKLYRNQLKTLDSLEKYLRSDELDSQEMYKVLNRILKLFLIHYSKDREVISLSGSHFKKWVENKSAFSSDLNPIFDDSIYKKDFENNLNSSKADLNSLSQFRTLLQDLDRLFKQSQETSV